MALTDDQDRLLAVLTVSEKYAHDKRKECEKVYRTTEDASPRRPRSRLSQGDVCLAGALQVLTPRYEPDFTKYRLTPAQTRAAFAEHVLADRGGVPDA